MKALLTIQLAFLTLGACWLSVALWRIGRRSLRTGSVPSIGSKVPNKRQHTPLKYWALVACYFILIPFVLYGFVRHAREVCDELLPRLMAAPALETGDHPAGLIINKGLLLLLALVNIPVYGLVGRLVFFTNFKDALETAKLSMEPEDLSMARGMDRLLGNKLSDFVLWGFLLACAGVVWVEYVLITEFLLK